MGFSCIFKMAWSSDFQGLKETFCYLELPPPCFWMSEGLMPVALTGLRYSLVHVLPACPGPATLLRVGGAAHWQLLTGWVGLFLAGLAHPWLCCEAQDQLHHAWTHPLGCRGDPGSLYPVAKWAPQLHEKTPLQTFLLRSSTVYWFRIRIVLSQEGYALPQHWKGNPLSSNRPFSSLCVHLTDLLELRSPFFVRTSITITDNGNCAHLNPCLC